MSEETTIDNTEKLRIEVEKIKAEISKINAETLNLNRPFILSPGTWGILATAIVGLGGFFTQLYNSDIERDKANMEYKKAEVLKESALLKAEQAEERAKKADEKYALTLTSVENKTKVTDDKIAEAQTKLAAGKTEEAKAILSEAQTSNQAASIQSTQAIKQISQNSIDSAKFTRIVASTLPIRVFPQIADEKQRIKALDVSAKLKSQGFNMQDIDNVDGEAGIPEQTEIRYFRVDEKEDAEKLLKILQKDFNLANSIIKFVTIKNYTASSRTLEIWFSKNAF